MNIAILISLSLVCFLCVIAIAQDTCTTPINTYLQCVKTAEDAAKASHDQMKQQEQACFTNNGCQVPQWPHGPRGHGGKKGKAKGHGMSNSEGADDNSNSNSKEINQTRADEINKTRTCEKAIHQKFEQQVDQCVQSATGLTISRLSAGHKKFYHQGPHSPGQGHPGQGGVFGKAFGNAGSGDHPCGVGFNRNHFNFPGTGRQQINGKENGFKKDFAKACNGSSDPQAASKVSDCLQGVRNSSRQQASQIFQQLAAAVNACRQSYENSNCNSTNLRNALKSAACVRRNCSMQAWEAFNNSKDSFISAIQECNGVTLPQEKHRGLNKAHKGPGRRGNHFGKEEGWKKACEPNADGPAHGRNAGHAGYKTQGNNGGRGQFHNFDDYDHCEVFEGQNGGFEKKEHHG